MWVWCSVSTGAASRRYCLIVSEVQRVHTRFRVLALSATPGKDRDKIQDVIKNLMITHLEVRGDDDPDVRRYAPLPSVRTTTPTRMHL